MAEIDHLSELFTITRAPNGEIHVGLTARLSDQDTAELQAAGFGIGSQIGDVATVQTTAERLPDLALLPSVRTLSAGAYSYSLVNDLARRETGVDNLSGQRAVSQTGAGVVVGIIDSGLDFRHRDFTVPGSNGRQTRIKAMLDLTTYVDNNRDGRDDNWDYILPGANASIGRLWTEAQINATLQGAGTVLQRDQDGHGTHVAGTAAGNGLAAPGTKYAGMAPNADLIVVKGSRRDDPPSYGTGDEINGLDFIRQRAAELGKPFVINMSLGGHFGAHDGTNDDEVAIDNLVNSGPGRAVVIAAGNEGSANIHASGTVAAGSSVTLNMSSTAPNFLFLTYPGNDRFTVTVRQPNGAFQGPFAYRSDAQSQDTTHFLLTNARCPDANNTNCIIVGFKPGAQTLGTNWSFTLQGQSVTAGGAFDAWVGNGAFTSHVDGSKRVGMPGTARGAITVGAWVTRPVPNSDNAIQGAFADFTSPGPTRDGRQKPEISAPGAVVFSSQSSDSTIRDGFLPDPTDSNFHAGIWGTSMAAPVVTGAVALMLEANPNLTVAQIKEFLKNTATKDAFTGQSDWHQRFGFGKLNVAAAINAVLGAAPPTPTSTPTPTPTVTPTPQPTPVPPPFPPSPQLFFEFRCPPALNLAACLPFPGSTGGIATTPNGLVFASWFDRHPLGIEGPYPVISAFAPGLPGQEVARLRIPYLSGVYQTAMHFTTDPTTGWVVGLLNTGHMFVLDPGTGQNTLLFGGRRLVDLATVDVRDVFNVMHLQLPDSQRTMAGFVNPYSAFYNDIAVRQVGDQIDLFVTGMYVGRPFVMRVRLSAPSLPSLLSAPPSAVSSKVIAYSLAPPEQGNAPGVAVNTDGTVLTSLPVCRTLTGRIACEVGYYAGVSFGADFPEDQSQSAQPRLPFGTASLPSWGMTADPFGNFFVATGGTGTSLCQGSTLGGLVRLPRSLRADDPAFYCFPQLPAPSNVPPTAGDVSLSPAGNVAYVPVNYPAGQNVVYSIKNFIAQFGVPVPLPPVTTHRISGRVTDAQGNGLDGVRVALTGGREDVAQTSAGGNYTFTNLPAGGNYTVSPLRTGTTFNPANRSFNNLSADQTNINFTVAAATALGSISGQKFNDLNDNGVKDAGEPGLAGWRIFIDADNDGGLDAGETNVVTDGNGNYRLGDLVAGAYFIREVQQGNWRQTHPQTNPPSDRVGWRVSLNPVRDEVNLNFGNTLTTQAADLAVTLIDEPDPVLIGADLTYTATLLNRGPAPATAATLTVSIPANVLLVSVTATQGTCGNTNPLVCNFGDLPAALSAGVSVVVRPNAAGTLGASASVQRSQPDPDMTNNSAATTTTVNAPPPPCSYALAPGNREHGVGSEQGSFNINTGDGCAWSVVNNNTDFINITSATSGQGPGAVNYTVAANTGPSPRAGTLSVQGQTFTVTQAPPVTPLIAFAAATFAVGEGDGHATVTATRTGDAASAASIDYATLDNPAAVRCDDTTTAPGVAFARCDYATGVDTLHFAAGETTKSFTIPIINDGHVENSESLTVRLHNPTGAALGEPNTTTVTILDNDTAGAANPVFASPFFVRMQYLDFLSREPETDGLAAWLRVLNNCSDVNNNPACDRLTVSSSFFRSQEFQLKGYFVFLFYKASFARRPEYAEIIADMRSVTGQTPAEVFQKRAQFADAFARRQEFRARYDGLPDAAFVDALLNRYQLAQITTPDPQNPDGTAMVTLNKQQLLDRLAAGTLTRARVLRAIVQSREVDGAEFNGAFVAMQYYGYLRRTPEEEGYQAWLRYLNANPTDFRTMVNGFMNSPEYRLRFGQP